MSNSDAATAASEVPVAEVRLDGVDELIARVRERRYVTTAEIFAALPNLEPETSELAAIFTRIEASGVEVISEVEEELRREDERRVGRGEAPAERRLPPAAPVSTAIPRPGAASDASAAARHARARRGPSVPTAAEASTRCVCTSRRSARSRCSRGPRR